MPTEKKTEVKPTPKYPPTMIIVNGDAGYDCFLNAQDLVNAEAPQGEVAIYKFVGTKVYEYKPRLL